MKRLLSVISLVVFSSCSQGSSETKHFVCDVLNDLNAPVDPKRPFDGKFDYFDRIFYYEKTGAGPYKAEFPSTKTPSRLSGDILSTAYLTASREQQGFYREIFDVYRFNIKTQILVHSYLYYVDPEDFNKNFNNPQFIPYNQPLLFDLVEKPAPENYVKIGWDKTKWRCYRISRFRYQYLSLFGVLVRLLSA